MTKKLSGEEKAAVLLLALGENAAAEVMKHLDPKEIRRLGGPMAMLSDLTPELRNEVMQEFRMLCAQGADVGIEGKTYMKKILTKALGPQKAQQLLTASSTSQDYNGLESLKWLDAKAIARILSAEHPQTAAVMVAHLEPEQASPVLALLPEELRLDIAYRLGTMEEIHPDILKELSEVLEAELKVGSKSQGQQLGGVEFLADVMNALDKTTEQALTTGLAERNADLAESVRQLMFVFDDLAGVEDRGLQDLLKEIAKEDLLLALRAAGEPVKEAIFRNMSARAAELLKDDMEAGGPVKLSDAEKAQRNILQVARKLEEEGRIVLGGKSGQEMLV
jgi:flagellar motor switch protein FliG